LPSEKIGFYSQDNAKQMYIKTIAEEELKGTPQQPQ
jgi:hypothetical protein